MDRQKVLDLYKSLCQLFGTASEDGLMKRVKCLSDDEFDLLIANLEKRHDSCETERGRQESSSLFATVRKARSSE
jgi:hypothetical protein